MALVKDSLWDIVKGTETLAEGANADARKKFVARSDRALAIIVLAVDPSLLYLLGEPENPGAVWTRLEEQFQRKTWANKLHMRRKLYALRLKEGGSVNDRMKMMTEIFEALAVIGDVVSEEDRVVHLLASLPSDSVGGTVRDCPYTTNGTNDCRTHPKLSLPTTCRVGHLTSHLEKAMCLVRALLNFL